MAKSALSLGFPDSVLDTDSFESMVVSQTPPP